MKYSPGLLHNAETFLYTRGAARKQAASLETATRKKLDFPPTAGVPSLSQKIEPKFRSPSFLVSV